MKKYLSLLWPLYLSSLLLGFNFILPIWILFFQSRGLNLAEIGFVATGIYLASVLLEYPTGIFTDKYGRKISLIISILLCSVAVLIQVTAHSTSQFFAGAVLTGAAWAFSSGAKEALVYDLLKEKNLEKFNSKVLGSLDTVGAVGSVLSALLGSWLFTLEKTLPYWISIISFSLAFIPLLWIKEPKYKEEGTKIGTFDQFKGGLKLALRNPVLLSLLLLYVPLFFFEEAWYNAQQPILVGLGLPILFLGTYAAGKTIVFALGGVTLPRLLDKFSHKTLLISIIILEFLVWLILGFDNLYAVVIFAYLLLLLHQFWNYVDADIIHEHIPSHIRATTLSARQTVISVIWIFNPWLMGYLMDTFSRNILFPVFGGIILIFVTAVFLFRKKYF